MIALALAAAGLLAPDEPPRLLVLVVVDQLRGDHVERFAPAFAPDGGFAELARRGTLLPARYPFTSTATGPGHAAIATGCHGARAGVPANEWYEQGRHVYCVECAEATTVGGPGVRPRAVSAEVLQRETLGDALQRVHGEEALVLSFALKDRAALLLGGRRSDGSFWIDDTTNTWVTSSGCLDALPEWLVQLNSAGPVASYSGREWRAGVPEELAAELAGLDDQPGEQATYFGDRTLPHALPDPATARLLYRTPFGDELLLQAARHALGDTELGRDSVPDLLALGFSSLDYIGHAFGPDSRELLEEMVLLDRRLAELIELLDEHVGAEHWVLGLSADHGVAPLPELSGGTRLDLAELRHQLEAALGGGEDVAAMAPPSVWLHPHVDRQKAAALLEALPHIEAAATREQLAQATEPPLSDLALDVHPERSGDVLFLVERFVILGTDDATSHGTHHDYDRSVPVILAGKGLSGLKAENITPLDVAPTLAAVAGFVLEGADGRVLIQP